MDFKDSIKQISERVEKLKDNLHTEEATKNALIMPFLQVLGYDVFNPLEVLPEMDCDLIKKKGDKIDYAILKDGQPIILIECKHWQQDLTLHDNQLQRYFVASKAKFGILTNGILYRFYTDLVKVNIMDDKPFLEVNMLDIKEPQIDELRKFHKSYFNIDEILSSASELKYMGELKSLISKEFSEPSPDFVRYFAKQVYDGVITSKVLDLFTELMKRSLSGYFSDKITGSLKNVIKEQEKGFTDTTTDAASVRTLNELPDGIVYMSQDGTIVTTQEEIEGFCIIRSILRKYISVERITYRDAQSYFAVFVDDNNRKPVCRLYLNAPTNKRLTFIDDNKKEIHHKISSIDDIYEYSELLINAINKYL